MFRLSPTTSNNNKTEENSSLTINNLPITPAITTPINSSSSTNNNNTDIDQVHVLLHESLPARYIWRYRDTFMGRWTSGTVAKFWWDLIIGSPARMAIVCLVTAINYVLIFLGLFGIGGTVLTLVGVLFECLVVWFPFTFMVNRPLYRALIKRGDFVLYIALALTGGLSMSHCMHWDMRTSFTLLLVVLVHSTCVMDAYHPSFLRLAAPFAMVTSIFYGAICVCLSLGLFPNVTDEILDLGDLDGVSMRRQTFSVLQLSISCFFTLFVAMLKNSIHIMFTRREYDTVSMKTFGLPILTYVGDD
jgi:hypothetical protein